MGVRILKNLFIKTYLKLSQFQPGPSSKEAITVNSQINILGGNGSKELKLWVQKYTMSPEKQEVRKISGPQLNGIPLSIQQKLTKSHYFIF